MKFELINGTTHVSKINDGDLFCEPDYPTCVYMVGSFIDSDQLIAMEIESGETYVLTERFDQVILLQTTAPVKLIRK